MRRGQIYLCEFPNPVGSEPGWDRPVVIIQDDFFNSSGIATTIVVTLTSSLKYQKLPGCLLLKKEETGLDRDSVANATQLSIVNKVQLKGHIGEVPDDLLFKLEECVKVVLGMS